MAKTKAKKTVTAIMKTVLSENEKMLKVTYGTGEKAVDVLIKPYISLSERVAMVSDILDMIFISDIDGNYEYHAAIKTFAIEYAIVNYFTDIRMPIESDKANEFLTMTDIANKIIAVLELENSKYISNLLSEIYEAIEHRKQKMLRASKLDSIFNGINSLVNVATDKIKNADASQIIGFMEKLEKYSPEIKGDYEESIKEEAKNTTE